MDVLLDIGGMLHAHVHPMQEDCMFEMDGTGIELDIGESFPIALLLDHEERLYEVEDILDSSTA